MSDKPLIILKNITKSFWLGDESVPILKGIDLQIFAGEMVAIVGQSGSGKSTLMNILALLDAPSTGGYYFNQDNLGQMGDDERAKLRAERFGFVFQRYQLLPALTAKDNVALPAIYAGTPKRLRDERAVALLEKLGLGNRLMHYPNQLSGGQQQRVSIARALMNGGQVIFADEPTGALDSQSGREVMAILRQLNDEGHTVILVTHDPAIAQSADRVITILDGQIIKDEKLSSRPIVPLSPASQKTNHLTTIFAFKESLVMAFLAMTKNKMRTLLTMLGIIIGIASVMLVVGLGNGSKQQVLKDINAMGSATLTVMVGESGEKTSDVSTWMHTDDIDALAKLPFVAGVSPELSSTMMAVANGQEKSVEVSGVNAGYDKLQTLKWQAGGMFNGESVKDFAQSVVISNRTAKALFGNTNAIGKTITLDGVPCQVVGVFVLTGYQASYERGLKIWLPYSTYQMRFVGADTPVSVMSVLLKPNTSSALASEQVKKTLSSRHNNAQFTIFNSDSVAQAVEKTAKSLTLLISAIALISLLVGGIGVMNIMLVSVTERTAEIGVRMAVGANFLDIIRQFLIEAILVCVVGGLFGVGLAFGVGMVLQIFEIPVIFSLSSMIWSVVCASMIGVVFGFLPARRAANLNPIDALNNQ